MIFFAKSIWVRAMALIIVSVLVSSTAATSLAQDPRVFRRLDQGKKWTAADWNAFYTADQGSWIMPYNWMKALRQPDGQLFLRDSFTRYGFIPNLPNSTNPDGLPVGFLVARQGTPTPQFAMTCAACHTRQISVNGINYRVDGGPAFNNMYGFFKGVLAAVQHTMTDPKAFKAFQTSVKTPSDELKKQMQDWYALNDLVYGQGLPSTPWGIGRLDAVTLINNRVNGGFLGAAPNPLIPENVARATVPVRYPFLWNADRQDRTQWAGTTVNGNQQYAMQRNAAEASGVWSYMHPVNGDYLAKNSLNYPGLVRIGTLTQKIGPPKWPWAVNKNKASLGEFLFRINCAECHGIKPGEPRPPVYDTWRTPVVKVNTDTAYHTLLGQKASSSGILAGTTVPFSNPPTTISPAGASSLMLSRAFSDNALAQRFPGLDLSLSVSTEAGAYESRVLQGIWAAAPYLHNGSVPTLADLLKPAAQRPTSFPVGPVYDLKKVGLSSTQPGGQGTVRNTTGASQLDSGNSNAGHEFGVWLPAADKDALLEYLKTL